jgi:RHS repeat-associated protein
VRRFRYDSLGRLTHQKLAETTAAITDAGAFVGVGGSDAAWSDYFTYDGRSNLVTRTDARGVISNFTYTVTNQLDPLNRLQSVSYTVPSGSSIPAAATVSYVYETDATKDRTRVRQIVTNGVSTEALDYDSEGRLHQRALTLDGRPSYPFTTNYTYDSLDRVTDVTYPAQYGVAGSPRKVIHHDFDAASRLSGLKVNNVSHASEIGYNASSQTTSLKVGAAGANQMTETYAYDPLTGLLAGQKVFRGTDTAENRRLDLSYDYLREGTMSGRTGHLTKVTDNRDAAKNRHYEYDPLGRLRRATAGGAAGSWAQSYLYDRYGNRSHVLSQKTSDWVAALYNVVLNRAPDAGGLAAWDGALRQAYAQGQTQFLQAAKETAAGFFDSGEYLGRGRSNSDYVGDLYLAYFGREPDSAGWSAWTNALDGGATRASVRQGFAGSGEFANRVEAMYPGAAGGGAAAPSNLAATAETTAAQVKLGWTAPASGTVSHYRVERKASVAGQYALLATTTATTHADTQVTAEAAYLYRVTAVYANGSASGVSNAALGTTVTFTDDPLEAGVTTIMARHLGELRRAVNAVRRLAGMGDAGWTGAAEAGVVVRAVHVRELRERLGEALAALGLPAPSYDDPTLEAGATVIRAAHFNQLRRAAGRSVGAAVGGSSAPAAPRDGHAYLSFDPQTNRVNTAGWGYDAAGNQTRALLPDGVSWRRFEYDAANRLVRVKADDNQTVLSSYSYGDSNQRLISDEGGSRTYYAAEGGRVLAEYVESGTQANPQWAKSYVYLGGRLLSTFAPVTGGELTEHHHPDRLGTRLVTRPSDGTSFEQAHLPFGNDAPSESPSATNRRFTSYDRSGATGLDYAVNRRYDPVQGRFTQVDPIGMRATNLQDPQTLNLYSYCANDPVNHTDPDGLLFGWLKRLFKRVVQAFVKAVVAAVFTFITSGFNPTAALAAGAAAFLKEIGWPSKGWLPSIGRTPPTFPNQSVTLSQVLRMTPAGRQFVPDPRQYLTPGWNPYASHPWRDSYGFDNLLFPCKIKNVKITHYDQPKNVTPIGRTTPVEGRTAAADPTFFGFPYPRGRNQTRDDIRIVSNSQSALNRAGIIFDIPGVGRRRFEDVGGGVRGAWIDIYVEAGAKQLGTFLTDVTAYLPLSVRCPGERDLSNPIPR